MNTAPGAVSGERIFVEDLHPLGLFHAALVRSPIAHGRLRGVDAPKQIGRASCRERV